MHVCVMLQEIIAQWSAALNVKQIRSQKKKANTARGHMKIGRECNKVLTL